MGKPTTLELLLAKIAGETVTDFILLQTKVDHLLDKIAERVNGLLLPAAVDDDNGKVAAVYSDGSWRKEKIPFVVTFAKDAEDQAYAEPAPELIADAIARDLPIVCRYSFQQQIISTVYLTRTTLPETETTIWFDEGWHYQLTAQLFRTDDPDNVSEAYRFIKAELRLDADGSGGYDASVTLTIKEI